MKVRTKESMMANFVEMVLQGRAKADDLDDYIWEWHASDLDIDLHEFLGFTEQEWNMIVPDHAALKQVLASRRQEA